LYVGLIDVLLIYGDRPIGNLHGNFDAEPLNINHSRNFWDVKRHCTYSEYSVSMRWQESTGCMAHGCCYGNFL